MFDPQHFGLYYSPAQVEYAQTHRDEPPFQQAWDWLAQHRELDLLEIALCSALRYRFAGDIEAGERGMNILEHDALRSLPSDPIARMGSLMGYAQAFETLRDYPGFVQQQPWLMISRLC